MPDFIPVLVVAVILFTILLIIFGGNFISFVSTPSRFNNLPPDETINFGSFETYYTASEVNAANANGEASNGVFQKNDDRIGFIAMNPDKVSEGLIDLKVSDTNFYGRMIISINGKEIYSDYPAVGETLISFDSSILQENNILEIKAESSGWRIWAPTVYDFSLNVKLDYTGRRSKSFIFELSSLETQYMTKARVIAFGNRTGVGNLNVVINGVVVANSATTLYQDFPTSDLRTGNNTIEFSAEPNTTYDISSSQLILFFE
jgi:hypothetical protein